MREDEVAFEARNVEVLVAGRDDEERVDVSRDELDPPVVSWCRPLEQARPFKDAHEAVCIPVDQQPVANGGSILRSLEVDKLDEIESSIASPETVTLPRWNDITRTGRQLRLSSLETCSLKKGLQPSCGSVELCVSMDWMGRSHLKTRALNNVATEASLHILAYSIKPAIALLGS